MNELTKVTPKQLRRAADLKEIIDGLLSDLHRLLGSSAKNSDAAVPPKKRRKMNRVVRARMAAAARARWAKVKGTATAAKPTKKRKRKMSAAVKARLSAMARERWKKAKAQGKATL
jgi:hypothetical protein